MKYYRRNLRITAGRLEMRIVLTLKKQINRNLRRGSLSFRQMSEGDPGPFVKRT